jgi:DNA-binding winged helix-turn-helix (wHTH) protein/cytochrome c-type biogenesis protein CcmH/NrfG
MDNGFKHGFQCGEFAVEPLRGCVTGHDGQPRHLPPKAIEVLICLAAAAPETLTRRQLLNKVWGERFVSDEVLTHAITELRHALGDEPGNPAYIETIPKRGYRLLKTPLPFEGPGPHRRAGGWHTQLQQRLSGAVMWRSQGISVFLLLGMVAALAAALYLRPASEDEPPGAGNQVPVGTPGQPDSTPSPGPVPGGLTVSERLLQAESLERQVTPENSRQAELLLEQVLSIEPHNALAWSMLGRIYYRQTTIFHTRPAQEGSELARQAIQRALVVDSNFGPAYADRALVSMTFDFDFDEAFRNLRTAQHLSPSDPYVLQVAAKMEMTHAHLGHAIDLLERSVSIDPYSCMAYARLGQAYYFANRLDDAEKSLHRSLSLNPGVVRSRYLLGLVRLAQQAAQPALAVMAEERDEGFRMTGIAIVRYALNEKQASDQAIDSLNSLSNGRKAYNMATVYALRGQHAEALDWLELAYEQRDEELLDLLVDPAFAGLRSEARWSILVEKLGLPHQI